MGIAAITQIYGIFIKKKTAVTAVLYDVAPEGLEPATHGL